MRLGVKLSVRQCASVSRRALSLFTSSPSATRPADPRAAAAAQAAELARILENTLNPDRQPREQAGVSSAGASVSSGDSSKYVQFVGKMKNHLYDLMPRASNSSEELLASIKYVSDALANGDESSVSGPIERALYIANTLEKFNLILEVYDLCEKFEVRLTAQSIKFVLMALRQKSKTDSTGLISEMAIKVISNNFSIVCQSSPALLQSILRVPPRIFLNSTLCKTSSKIKSFAVKYLLKLIEIDPKKYVCEASFVNTLKVCLLCNDVQQAHKLLDALPELRTPEVARTMNALDSVAFTKDKIDIHTFLTNSVEQSSGDADLLAEFLHEVLNSCRKSGKYDDALIVWQAIADYGVEYSSKMVITMLNLVLDSLSKRSFSQETRLRIVSFAGNIYESLLQDASMVDSKILGLMMNIMSSLNDCSSAFQVWDLFEEREIRKTIESYNAYLRAHLINFRLTQPNQMETKNLIFDVFSELTAHHLSPDVVTLNTMLSICSSSADMSTAFQVWDQFKKYRIPYQTKSYNCLLYGFMKQIGLASTQENLSSCYQFFSEMLSEAKLIPDNETLYIMLKISTMANNVEMGFSVWVLFEKYNVKPSVGDYETFCQLLLSSSQSFPITTLKQIVNAVENQIKRDRVRVREELYSILNQLRKLIN